MEWTRVKPCEDSTCFYWVAGIYKVVQYDGEHYHAYFIQDHYKNWGDNPSKPPCKANTSYHSDYWPSLASAQYACEQHAEQHRPKPHTVRRAKQLLESFVAA